ncbi:class I SAM-dependent methyltransferase [Motiliproteus coralliicola]|uniref:Class I SAM-dependent methyltransferase n=1 Tax=Motiliproteus coralliicola TaxID=2283196 RepID=A0A369WNY5_9GAMM|nr:class I SAM-dependent methyltransferase [Motiliproteus coralliicola]RDE22933.1 class I SAM-dependent methyltransferase [Motiliproteus coralliicola]
MTQLFDDWPDPYEQWFQTPIGQLVYQTELALILDQVQPQAGENVLDAGCGSGIFTAPLIERGVRITGVDLSLPMLSRATARLPQARFAAADIGKLPFADNTFDKCVSITALEFIEDAEQALGELFRVTRPGGKVVVATLNSLSPWAARRHDNAKQDKDSVFNHAWFRSPDELLALTPISGETHTAVHFDKHCELAEAKAIEQQGLQQQRNDGAFLIGSWIKP